MSPATLLAPSDPAPVLVEDRGIEAPFLVVCDHAGNAIAACLDGLGLPEEARTAHIAWDLHALPFAQALAAQLGATLVAQRYSRLVVDCNRQLHARDSMAAVSDGVVIPGNALLREHHREARAAEILQPYQGRIAAEIALRRPAPFSIISVHSCTSRLQGGLPRPWHLGLISGPDARLRRALFEGMQAADGGFTVGENVPYVVDMVNDYTLPVHAEAQHIPYVELEWRNDVIADPVDRSRLVGIVAKALWASTAAWRVSDARV